MLNGHKRGPRRWFTLIALSLLGLVTLTGFQACNRHRWSDPERLDKRMAWIADDVAEELELRPEQKPAFDALTGRVQTQVRGRVDKFRQAGLRLEAELSAETVDPDRIGALVKEHLRQRMAIEEQEALVDDFVAFYKTLDPEQQQLVREKALRHLERHH